MTPEEKAEQESRDMARVRQHMMALFEHFDTVQIFVTKRDPDSGGTINASLGEGNWFARYGQISIWTEQQKEGERCAVRNVGGIE